MPLADHDECSVRAMDARRPSSDDRTQRSGATTEGDGRVRRCRRFLAVGVLAVTMVTTSVLAGSAPAFADDPTFVDWTSLLPSFTDAYDPTSENDCVAGKPNCID